MYFQYLEKYFVSGFIENPCCGLWSYLALALYICSYCLLLNSRNWNKYYSRKLNIYYSRNLKV